MLYGAIFRAVLRPDENRWGYLRLGKDELLLGVLLAIFYIGFVALLAMAIFVAVLLTAAAAYASTGLGVAVGVVLTLGHRGRLHLRLAARLSMVLPMSFDEHRFRIAEALGPGPAGTPRACCCWPSCWSCWAWPSRW